VSSLALYAIVRDEEKRLPTFLKACERFCDAYLICDTGSKDRTRTIARRWLKTHEGRLIEHPWQDSFADSLNVALKEARSLGTSHLFQSGVAEVPRLLRGRPAKLPSVALVPWRLGNLHWTLPFLHAADTPCEYVGRTHSYLRIEQNGAREARWLSMTDTDPHTDRPAKLERDRRLLELDHLDDPAEPRWVFYLAQTYRILGNPEKAGKLYRLRQMMGGWEEEAWYAGYMEGLLCDSTHLLLKAWERRPTRAEPLRVLERGYRSQGCEQLANWFREKADAIPWPTGDTLFIETDSYAEPPADATP